MSGSLTSNLVSMCYCELYDSGRATLPLWASAFSFVRKAKGMDEISSSKGRLDVCCKGKRFFIQLTLLFKVHFSFGWNRFPASGLAKVSGNCPQLYLSNLPSCHPKQGLQPAYLGHLLPVAFSGFAHSIFSTSHLLHPHFKGLSS